MVKLKNYCKIIQQAKDKNNTIERSGCSAVIFDHNDNGIVKFLDASYGGEVVDYIEQIENGIILIECKDLFSQLKHKSEIDILSNLSEKYQKSINVIKKHINQKAIFVSYYLVVKDNTDMVVIDSLFPYKEVYKRFGNSEQTPLKESFIKCKTNEICDKLSKFDTRLCQ